jgi:hypothetical protein
MSNYSEFATLPGWWRLGLPHSLHATLKPGNAFPGPFALIFLSRKMSNYSEFATLPVWSKFGLMQSLHGKLKPENAFLGAFH